jgi:pimeloyl-ACP methyl ester carboxylesterase
VEVEVNGATLHYDIHGEGEPLLWLHGFSGSGADWKHVFADVPSGFELIAPDLRGHGRSTNPSGVYTFRQSALDTLALLRRIGRPRVKAVGLSGGGITLLHMATIAADSLSDMVIVSAPPYFPAQARTIQRQFSLAMLSEHEQTLLRQRHHYGAQQIEQILSQARAFADSYDDVNFTPPYLSTISARTLIVFGDRDPLYPVSLAIELHAAIPGSSLWIVPNGGHGPIFGPGAAPFAATSLAFLRGEWAN